VDFGIAAFALVPAAPVPKMTLAAGYRSVIKHGWL